MEENSRNVQISWAGRVRTGNKRVFDYTKDFEVVCKFKEMLTREAVYKELEKVKWPLLSIVGMVLRPGGLVDFTLKSKNLAFKFAKSLSNLESVQNATVSIYIISDRFNIQTETRVFKMERKNLETNPIPSNLYFGQYKFRVRYQGQSTTCGYCTEGNHVERNCPKKANMKIMAKNSKLQKRQASRNEKEKKEPTKQEVAKSFERDSQEKKKRENQDEKAEANKRPLSDSSSSPPNQPQRSKNLATEKEIISLFDLDPEISSDSSTEFDEIKPYANPCCYELIQKCTGRHFACACEQQYFKCKCGWKNIGKEKGAYQCEQCKDIVANCVSCGSLQIKKKGKLFNCENCHCQLTKELHRSSTF